MTTVIIPTSTQVPRPVPRTTSIATSTVQVAKRALLRFFRTPQLIVMGTAQMGLFLFIYRYVLGGAVNPLTLHGTKYVDFLVPGFVATGVLFSGIGAATGVADDLQQGFVDRLRSLPVPRASFLAGRALADTLTGTWGLLVATAVGFAVGFRPHGPVADDLAAFGLCIVFALAFEWMFIAIGLVGGTPQGATGIAMVVFPLAFLSSSYVPVSTMPGCHLHGRCRQSANARPGGRSVARALCGLFRGVVFGVGGRCSGRVRPSRGQQVPTELSSRPPLPLSSWSRIG